MSSDNVDSNISISEYKKQKEKMSSRKTITITLVLIILIVFFIIVSGFIGHNFLNLFLFSLIFGFPLLIIYRIQIIKKLPENVANWFVDETHELEENTLIEFNSVATPFYQREIQILVLGILSIILSIYMIIKRRRKFVGLMMSLFFAIIGAIFIVDLF